MAGFLGAARGVALASLVVGGVAFTSPCAAADAAKGKLVFLQQCSTCHSPVKGAAPILGPSLFGVVGRAAGTLPGYSYSVAMKAAGGTWTPQRLDTYIASPQATIPGIKMPYAGLKDATKRRDLIAFLATLK